MGRGGRFGKYGDLKRKEKIREARRLVGPSSPRTAGGQGAAPGRRKSKRQTDVQKHGTI